MADEGSATVVAFIGAALMVMGSIMSYNIAGEDCDYELDRYGYTSDEYEDCSEELFDQNRLASLIYSAGYPILLFSLALAIINRG